MAKPTTAWGIDIGQVALKALKVQSVDGELQVEAFDVVEHAKILSQPDANRQQLIQACLEQFLVRHNVSGSLVAVSPPGQSGFTRFVKLPPVDTKKIPDIVRYEAEQQIPFPIGEVNWRWQTFLDPNSPDVEVGIFAMKRTDVSEALNRLSMAGLEADIVQMGPLALCNFMTYDRQLAEEGATLLVDVGTDKTDLVVSDGSRIWTRTIQIGGNNFTEALVRAFKLSFSKAEKLKRTAATSKYARQIFQAMRPVFADLVQEVQRSIGYYTSLHRETRFLRLIGLGNGFRLPGLQKYLEQNLNISVMRIDSYNRLTTGEAVNAPTFHENVLSFAVAYGLAVQALGQARVQTNLLPSEIARQRMWNGKRPWFAAAAGLLVVLFCLPMFRAFADRHFLAAPQNVEKFNKAAGIAANLGKLQEEFWGLQNQGEGEKREISENVKLLGHRDFWPSVLAMVSESIKAASVEGGPGQETSDQEMLTEYAEAGDDQTREQIRQKLKSKNRSDRSLIIIKSLTANYLASLSAGPTAAAAKGTSGESAEEVQPGAAPAQAADRGFSIVLRAQTPYGKPRDLIASLRRKSKEILTEAAGRQSGARPSVRFVDFGLVSDLSRVGVPPGGGADEPKQVAKVPDPLFPDEDMAADTIFEVRWLLAIESDGVPLADEQAKGREKAPGGVRP